MEEKAAPSREAAQGGAASPQEPGEPSGGWKQCLSKPHLPSPAFVLAVLTVGTEAVGSLPLSRWTCCLYFSSFLFFLSFSLFFFLFFLLFFFSLPQAKPWSQGSQWQNCHLFLGDPGTALCKWIGIKWQIGCGRILVPQQIDENLNHLP